MKFLFAKQIDTNKTNEMVTQQSTAASGSQEKKKTKQSQITPQQPIEQQPIEQQSKEQTTIEQQQSKEQTKQQIANEHGMIFEWYIQITISNIQSPTY